MQSGCGNRLSTVRAHGLPRDCGGTAHIGEIPTEQGGIDQRQRQRAACATRSSMRWGDPAKHGRSVINGEPEANRGQSGLLGTTARQTPRVGMHGGPRVGRIGR